LGRQARSCGGERGADGRGRPGDELGNRGGGNEASAANQDAGELARPKEPVDRVPGNATEEAYERTLRLFAHGSGNECCKCREDTVAGVAGQRLTRYLTAFVRNSHTLSANIRVL